jgi:hypothetical protein
MKMSDAPETTEAFTDDMYAEIVAGRPIWPWWLGHMRPRTIPGPFIIVEHDRKHPISAYDNGIYTLFYATPWDLGTVVNKRGVLRVSDDEGEPSYVSIEKFVRMSAKRTSVHFPTRKGKQWAAQFLRDIQCLRVGQHIAYEFLLWRQSYTRVA